MMDCGPAQSVRDEYFTLEKERGWAHLFMEIRAKSSAYEYSFDESKSIKNRDLNRYRDVNPYDHSRVVLRRGNCDYINASFVKVPDAGREYILTQGPLSTTTSHFWLMVWESLTKAIIMLNNILERNQVKCHTYWPLGKHHGNTLSLPDVHLSVELISESYCGNYILRKFRLSDFSSNESREVDQFHYTAWPDFGVPSTAADFLQFLQDVRNTGGLGPGMNENPVGPAVVHCSAGIGRSGTFCLVDSVLLMLEKGIPVNIKDLVLEMRRYRPGLIQTAEQLRFSYLAIMEGSLSLPQIERDADFSPAGSKTETTNEDEDSSELETSDSEDEELLSEELEEDDSEEEAEEPEAPPPLPPRGESLNVTNYDKPLPEPPAGLKRSRSDIETTDTETSEQENEAAPTEEAEQNDSELEAKRRKEGTEETGESIPRTVDSEPVVRHRRQERAERTQQLVDSIKEKQRQSEQWQERKTVLYKNVKWIGMGVGLIFFAAVGLRYFH